MFKVGDDRICGLSLYITILLLYYYMEFQGILLEMCCKFSLLRLNFKTLFASNYEKVMVGV